MTTPCPAPFNLAAHVLARAADTPDKIALAVLGPARAERWSYARLEAAVRGMGSGLLAQGLQPGDTVMLRLGNTPDFPVAFLGCIAAGLIPVPTSAQLTGPEVTALARSLSPAAILAAPGLSLPDDPACPVLTDMAALMAHPPVDYAMGDPDRLAYLVFTSGTSGRPRAVAHAHRAIWARRMMQDGWYGLGPDDRLMHAGAFNWTYTLGTGLLDPWTVGATALIPADGTDFAALPLLMKRHDVSIFAAVPGVYRKLLNHGPLPALPRLRHALSAGEKLPETLRARWQAAGGGVIHEALGLSECSTFISGSPERPAPQGTLGFAQPGRRIAVLDEAGQPVAAGEIGTLAVHRSDPGLMLGYLEDGRLDLPLSGDWFETGDQVALEASGALSYHGRRDDMLNAGGFKVSPLEIEAVFTALAGVAECAAVAVEVAQDTHVIALAWCGPADAATLEEVAGARLARYKQPRIYRQFDTLPRNANGKLDRKDLRARLKET